LTGWQGVAAEGGGGACRAARGAAAGTVPARGAAGRTLGVRLARDARVPVVRAVAVARLPAVQAQHARPPFSEVVGGGAAWGAGAGGERRGAAPPRWGRGVARGPAPRWQRAGARAAAARGRAPAARRTVAAEADDDDLEAPRRHRRAAPAAGRRPPLGGAPLVQPRRRRRRCGPPRAALGAGIDDRAASLAPHGVADPRAVRERGQIWFRRRARVNGPQERGDTGWLRCGFDMTRPGRATGAHTPLAAPRRNGQAHGRRGRRPRRPPTMPTQQARPVAVQGLASGEAN
jgi:hypothetical protein